MPAPSYRVSLLGCGRISGKHVEAVQQVDGLQLAAVCDSDESLARATGERLGVPWFTGHEEMLDTVACEMVAVTTPSGLHPEHGIAAARRGRHVITEKPMAISLEGADALLEACEGAGVHLFVVKQVRLAPAVQLLRRAVDKGRFGQIHLVNSTVRWSRPQDYYDQAPWRGTLAMDGGAIMNQASHYVDLLQWMGGPVESVIGKTATLARRIETEDTGAAVVRFMSGALGVLEVTMLTYPHNLEGSITVMGEKGVAKLGGTAVNRIDHWLFADYDDDDKVVQTLGVPSSAAPMPGHVGYYQNVVAVLRGGAPAGTDGREGRKSLELIVAIYESAATGRDVKLPLKKGPSRNSGGNDLS